MGDYIIKVENRVKRFSYITTMNDKGEIVGQKKLPNDREVVEFASGKSRRRR